MLITNLHLPSRLKTAIKLTTHRGINCHIHLTDTLLPHQGDHNNLKKNEGQFKDISRFSKILQGHKERLILSMKKGFNWIFYYRSIKN